MLNRAPFNTEVPQFVPSRDAPINSYIIRKYPCQEHVAGKTNQFGSLTWKIQQPDSSMVWQSVKVVMPMDIQVCDKRGDGEPMDISSQRPTCNIALSQSPMNAFRQTSLSINGRIFSEDNFYRDILDACYRGVGAQAYGDNHSLRPIVYRNLKTDIQDNAIPVVTYDRDAGTFHHAEIDDEDAFVLTTDIQTSTVNTAFNLLEHNGPFIERARIFQDKLSFDGETWTGEISHLLELGPFQARARKGNTAVPYIQDFHLRLNFQNMESKFDVENPDILKTNPLNRPFATGRTMAPKLLEFATLPNFLHPGDRVQTRNSWPAGYQFTYTAQPYLEVVYTKHESPMRDSYNLRCFEHLYDQSNRFVLQAPADTFVSPKVLSRVTSRLLSLPTKIYVWGEVSDEFKYTFGMGGVRRSCLLENLHLRVNQRPDVMFNPSQEECYEMFRRHTNSNLEYGSWLKSPIYCFDMVDVGQPDMFSNDARISWFEWDAAVSLTPLQICELNNLHHDNNLEAHGYDRRHAEEADVSQIGTWSSKSPFLYCWIDTDKQRRVTNTQTSLHLTIADKRSGETEERQVTQDDWWKLNGVVLVPEEGTRDAFTYCDWIGTSTEFANQSVDGCIWGIYIQHSGGGHNKGDILGNALYYIPQSHRFITDDNSAQIFNNFNDLTFDAKIRFTNPDQIPVWIKGELSDNGAFCDQDEKSIGHATNEGATWSPGPFGYTITGAGIANNTLLQNRVGTGTLPTVADLAGSERKWICFGPMPNMKPDVNGGADWMKWRATRSQDQLQIVATVPTTWPAQTAGEVTQWGYGTERLNIEMAGSWGRNMPDTFDASPVVNRYGVQMEGVKLATEAKALKEDYQLKVLYEYGNCQYNFRRDAAPTRVLPNVVPVGPSPGLPQL